MTPQENLTPQEKVRRERVNETEEELKQQYIQKMKRLWWYAFGFNLLVIAICGLVNFTGGAPDDDADETMGEAIKARNQNFLIIYFVSATPQFVLFYYLKKKYDEERDAAFATLGNSGKCAFVHTRFIDINVCYLCVSAF